MKYIVTNNKERKVFDNIEDAEFELSRNIFREIEESDEMFADCCDSIDLGEDWEAFKAETINQVQVDNWVVTRE